jgi:hypothetical protein
MKHQKWVFYLTHTKVPALVHGISYLLTLIIPIVSLCLLPVTSFAGLQDNVIVKKDDTLTIEPGVANALPDNIVLSQSLLILRNFLSPETAQETSPRQIRAGNISTNPADVEPFRGTTWEFTCIICSSTYTDTISFSKSVTVATDGTVVLLGTNQNGSSAAIGYGPSLGIYLIVIKEGIIPVKAYVVTLNGCCKVQGQYYMTLLDPYLQNPYPLTGIRTSPPVPTDMDISPPKSIIHPSATRDFDGDGKDDILWYNKVTGDLFLYTSSKGDYPAGNVPVDIGWIPVGVFDYDKDGQADILWWNQKTGEVYVWLGNNKKGSIGFVPDTQWQLCCGGDVDGNGFGDILWFNQTTGEFYVWYDDNQKKVPYGGVDPKSGWLPRGVADFDGDGRGDILLWSQQSGELFFGTTKNGNYPLSGVPIATGWMVAGVGDFDGDGTPDILWWNQKTGEVYIWDNGGKGLHHSRGLVADLNWSPR